MNSASGEATTLSVEVCPGDCDPAGIVCLARYQRWIEAASTHAVHGATLLLEQRLRFVHSATWGDKLLIRSHIEGSGPDGFVQQHTITRNDELICECTETRRSCRGDPGVA